MSLKQHELCCRIPRDIAQLDLTVEKAPRQDSMFMKKVRGEVMLSKNDLNLF